MEAFASAHLRFERYNDICYGHSLRKKKKKREEEEGPRSSKPVDGLYKGVNEADDGRFHAHIIVNGNVTKLGSFETATEAAKAYDAVARECYGDAGYVNFPEGESISEGHAEERAADEAGVSNEAEKDGFVDETGNGSCGKGVECDAVPAGGTVEAVASPDRARRRLDIHDLDR